MVCTLALAKDSEQSPPECARPCELRLPEVACLEVQGAAPRSWSCVSDSGLSEFIQVNKKNDRARLSDISRGKRGIISGMYLSYLCFQCDVADRDGSVRVTSIHDGPANTTPSRRSRWELTRSLSSLTRRALGRTVTLSDGPLARLGDKDITAAVNWLNAAGIAFKFTHEHWHPLCTPPRSASSGQPEQELARASDARCQCMPRAVSRHGEEPCGSQQIRKSPIRESHAHLPWPNSSVALRPRAAAVSMPFPLESPPASERRTRRADGGHTLSSPAYPSNTTGN